MNFYALYTADTKGALHVSMSAKVYSGEDVFYGSFLNEPIQLEYLQGKKPMDIIGCGWSYIYAISPKFESILDEFKGLKLYKTNYVGKTGDLTDYKILSVTGRCGEIKNELSEKRLMPPIVPWGKEYEAHFGLYFDIDTWDGSDFFVPAGSYRTFITEKVKEKLDKAQLSNLHIVPISEIENVNFMI